MKFLTDGNSLLCLHQGEKLRIEPWGRDSLRVRATMLPAFSDRDWALTEAVKKGEAPITVEEVDHWVGDGSIDKREQASIVNGRIKAVVNHAGVISFYRDDALLLREYFRAYDGTISRESRCLKIFNREWKGCAIIPCDEFSCPIKFTNRDTINWTFRGKNRTIGLEHKEAHYGRINVYESRRLLHPRSDT